MKRFCDTDRWIKDKWFCELAPRDKLFWIFMLDQCDNVGVWEVNMRIANVLTGYDFKEDELKAVFGDKITVIDDGCKWWIPSFIDFQHGALCESSASKPIISYISLLKKHTLWIPYTNRTQGVQGKGKGKGKGKGEGKGKKEYSDQFEAFWKIYKVGVKSPAFVAWKKQKLTDDEIKIIMECVPKYKAHCESADRSLKDGQGWLNQRFWETEWNVQGSTAPRTYSKTVVPDFV